MIAAKSIDEANARVSSLEAANESLRSGAEMLLRDLATERARVVFLTDTLASRLTECERLRAALARIVDDPYAHASTVPPSAEVGP